MKLKTISEDFRVYEISDRWLRDDGQFLLCRLTKRDCTTEHAMQTLARYLGIPRKKIGVAGTKDSRAITEQDITVPTAVEARIAAFSHENISVEIKGRVKESLRLGMLEENRFEIVVRDLDKDECCKKTDSIPNYFDEQRFSTNNVVVGKHLLLGQFAEAIEEISKTNKRAEEKMREHLKGHENDYVGALRAVPRHILLMYVHAFQSDLFNKVLRKTVESNLEVQEIPIVGFGSELSSPFEEWYEELLDQEGMSQRDFVVRQIPWLTLEGTMRKAYFALKNLVVKPREEDELHPGKEKQTFEFSIPKGCYATMAIKVLYSKI